MKKQMMQGLLATAIALGMSGAALGDDESGCRSRTLHGRYVFAARGFTIAAAGAAQPKAVVEVIDFDGDGGVSVPWVTVSLNGNIVQLSPGASGTYTINEACTGRIIFEDMFSTAHDFVTSPRGNEMWTIQTNPEHTVFQGTATRTLRAHDDDRE